VLPGLAASTDSFWEAKAVQEGMPTNGGRSMSPDTASATIHGMCEDVRLDKENQLTDGLVENALCLTPVIHPGVAMQYIWHQAPVHRPVNKMKLPFVVDDILLNPELYHLKVCEAMFELFIVWLTQLLHRCF
jgi:hypothetical protein